MLCISDALNKGRMLVGNSTEAEILLAHVLKKTREFLIIHPEARVSSAAYEKFIESCKKRKKGIPLAYVIKSKEFYGLDFYVDSRVLIPRPETELLVEEMLALAQKFKKPRILDIGTGSGCIAIALAKHIPNAKIIASDISKDALAVAKKNAKRHGVSGRIEFLQSDLLERVIDTPDIIVANLPYVPRKEARLVEAEVKKYEPPRALWAGYDGLQHLKKFLKQVQEMSHKPKYLVCEFGFSMKKSVQALLKSLFKNPHVIFKKDLAGRDRIFILSLLALS